MVSTEGAAYLFQSVERHNLPIRCGALTNEERFQINNHLVETLKMLATLPWPEHLQWVLDMPPTITNEWTATATRVD